MTKRATAKASATLVQHINPDHLPKNSAFTWVVSVTEPAKTVYIGGLDAVDASGTIVGKDDIGKQTEQVVKNLQAALDAAGAKPEHVVKWNIYIVQGQSLRAGFQAFQRTWGQQSNPPAITGVFVAGLANPDFLVEIDAIAVIPQ